MKLPLTLALDKEGRPRMFSDPAAALQDGNLDAGELFLVELQGKLEVQLEGEEQEQDDLASSSAAGQRIGRLDMSVPVRAFRRLAGLAARPTHSLMNEMNALADTPYPSDRTPPPDRADSQAQHSLGHPQAHSPSQDILLAHALGLVCSSSTSHLLASAAATTTTTTTPGSSRYRIFASQERPPCIFQWGRGRPLRRVRAQYQAAKISLIRQQV